MLLEKQMRFLHEAWLRREGCRSLAARRVRFRVRLLLANQSEPDEHTQAIGVRSEERLSTREQQDFLGARLSDPRKGPQLALGDGERLSD